MSNIEDNLTMINANASAIRQFSVEVEEEVEEELERNKLHAIYVLAEDILRKVETINNDIIQNQQ